MEGFIVCGGRGSRLGPLGAVVSKGLLPHAGAPILVSAIRSLRDVFGCNRITLLTGHLASQIQGFIEHSEPMGVEIRFLLDERGDGTHNSVRRALKDDSARFAYSHANIALSDVALASVREKFLNLEDGHSMLVASSTDFAPTHPHLSLNGSRVESIGPRGEDYPVTSVGLAIYDATIFAGSANSSTPDTPLEFGISTQALKTGRVRAADIGRDWFHLEDLSGFESKV